MAILSLFGGSAAKFVFWLLESWLAGKATTKESRKIFIDMAKFMRENGVASVQSRFEAEEQLAAGDDAWKEREKNEQPTPKN